jgi:hypothetical protein
MNIRRIIQEELKSVFDTKEKIEYPYYKIEKLIDYYKSEFSDYMDKQGWNIFQSDAPSLFDRYNSDSGYFWRVEVIDEPYGEAGFYDEEGNSLVGISTDEEAIELARKTGLMIDNLGVIIGFQSQSLL